MSCQKLDIIEPVIVLSAINCKYVHCALSLYYLKAFWLRKKNRPEPIIREFELNEIKEQILFSILKLNPSIVAFSTYIWSYETIMYLTGALKAASTDIKIILGGPEVSYNATQVLTQAPWIDYVVRHEGEFTFENLLDSLLKNKSVEQIKGISYIIDGQITHNPDRVSESNLDLIPSPFQLGFFDNHEGFIQYEASRGCNGACSYCLSSADKHVRYHSIDRVKNDLAWFMNSKSSQLRFIDRTFNHNQDRALEILDYILRNNVHNKKFHFEIQPEYINEKLTSLFAKAPDGLFHLEAGIQTTNKKALIAVNRSLNVNKQLEGLKQLIEHTNCHIHLDLLGGLPEDNFSNFKASLDTVCKLQPHDIQVNMIKALHGTKYRKECESRDIRIAPLPPWNVLSTPWLSYHEVIIICDIARLLKTVYVKYKLTVSLISKISCKSVFSDFFETLAVFCRKHNLILENSSAKCCRNVLIKYLDYCCKSKHIKVFKSILEHETILKQKVPTASENIQPFRICSKKSRFRLNHGIKIIWHSCNIFEVLKGNLNIDYKLYPTFYKYQPDLSKSQFTAAVNMPFEAAFLAGCLQARIDIDECGHLYKKIYSINTQPDFKHILDILIRHELVYDSKYNKAKKVGSIKEINNAFLHL